MEFTVRINEIEQVTHNVKCLRFEKPEHYNFIPGHAADVSINKPEWVAEKRPFTFTSLADKPYLEFTIKSYTDHDGVTNQIGQLQVGDELVISDSWGAIEYKGTGCFIAGGAGITPFIAILRQLHQQGKAKGNKLFFSNKTENDIIYKEELEEILGEAAVFLVSSEKSARYQNARINKAFINANIQDFNQPFYICGPDLMIAEISAILVNKGANPEMVVFEK